MATLTEIGDSAKGTKVFYGVIDQEPPGDQRSLNFLDLPSACPCPRQNTRSSVRTAFPPLGTIRRDISRRFPASRTHSARLAGACAPAPHLWGSCKPGLSELHPPPSPDHTHVARRPRHERSFVPSEPNNGRNTLQYIGISACSFCNHACLAGKRREFSCHDSSQYVAKPSQLNEIFPNFSTFVVDFVHLLG